MRILIVEDEAALRSFLVPLLEAEGFATACAATGAEALAEVEDRRPDLVLLDVGLPDISGLDVCRAIRRKPGHLPVIMLTALDTPEDELAGFAAAADDYIAKPFTPERLLARIRAVLRLAADVSGGHRVHLGDVEVDLALRTERLAGTAGICSCRRRRSTCSRSSSSIPGRCSARPSCSPRCGVRTSTA
jgi:DNA-binding response OmpR family regulator